VWKAETLTFVGQGEVQDESASEKERELVGWSGNLLTLFASKLSLRHCSEAREQPQRHSRGACEALWTKGSSFRLSLFAGGFSTASSLC
jgi:hypothetical protein